MIGARSIGQIDTAIFDLSTTALDDIGFLVNTARALDEILASLLLFPRPTYPENIRCFIFLAKEPININTGNTLTILKTSKSLSPPMLSAKPTSGSHGIRRHCVRAPSNILSGESGLLSQSA